MRGPICALLLSAWFGAWAGVAAPGFSAPADAPDASAGAPRASSPFPLQLEARVPFAPTAFPSAGRRYLAYELYLTNFSASPVSLSRIEVLDADGTASTPVAAFEGDQLDALLQPVGAQAPADKSDPRQLGPGATVIAFMWVPFEAGARVPDHLRHRVVTTDAAVDGAVIGTHSTELRVFAPPLQGSGWTVSDGPSNARENHHRRGVLALNGRLTISRRYAIDWMLYTPKGSVAYGEPVFAVADGTVVRAQDGRPDNVPAPVGKFHPAIPITLDTAGGNFIALDLGGGQYAWYFHLKPASLRVKAGDHVRRGEPLAQIGVSGDSNVPHLHLEVTTSPQLLEGEGVPYVIDSYRILTPDKTWRTRTRELPLDGMLVDFGKHDGD